MKRKTLLALATFGLVAAGAMAEPVDRLAIVDKAIAFHGGDLYRASETELDVCSRSGCFHVRARLDGDDFEFEVEGKARGSVRRVLWNPQRLERFEDGQPVPVAIEAKVSLQDWVMARVYFPFLPFRLNDPEVFKEDLGLVEWGGKKLHKVKVTFTPGSSTDASDEYLYWFDSETGRVEQFAYSFKGRPGGLRFRRALSHRRVGGILFFDQQNLGIEGEGLLVDDVTESFVKERMREVSVVRFDDVEVRPLR